MCHTVSEKCATRKCANLFPVGNRLAKLRGCLSGFYLRLSVFGAKSQKVGTRRIGCGLSIFGGEYRAGILFLGVFYGAEAGVSRVPQIYVGVEVSGIGVGKFCNPGLQKCLSNFFFSMGRRIVPE